MSDLHSPYAIATLGNYEVERFELQAFTGTDVAGSVTLTIPDPLGELQKNDLLEQPISLEFGYRDGDKADFSGTVKWAHFYSDEGLWRLRAFTAEFDLYSRENLVTESYTDESAQSVAKKLISNAGFTPGNIEFQDETLEHIVFSGRPVFYAIKQLLLSLQNGYGQDLNSFSIWADGKKVNISRKLVEEIFVIDNEIMIESHENTIECALIPSLKTGAKLKISNNNQQITVLARSVMHELQAHTARTKIIWEYLND